jgi:hypothetical protein
MRSSPRCLDEFDLAHWRHLRGAVLAVHRAAFEKDGSDDVVPAADIGQQLGQQIMPALRRIPKMMVGVDAELKAWLAKRPSEAALEPELPIIATPEIGRRASELGAT